MLEYLSNRGFRRVSPRDIENLRKQYLRHGPVRYEPTREGPITLTYGLKTHDLLEYSYPKHVVIKSHVEPLEHGRQGWGSIKPHLELDQDWIAKTIESYLAARDEHANQHHAPSNEAVELGIGIALLIAQVQRTVEESGDPDGFDAAQWVARWIKEPLPALGGERPVDLLGTKEGQAQVSKLIAQTQSGAYA